MNKRRKNALILSYFAKQRRKELTEIKEQKTDISRPTYSITSMCDSVDERTNLDRANAASDDITPILLPSKSINAG